MKTNIVVITLRSNSHISQFGVPFTSKKVANKYAEKVKAYWTKHTNFEVKVTVQNAMIIRYRVPKDWRRTK